MHRTLLVLTTVALAGLATAAHAGPSRSHDLLRLPHGQMLAKLDGKGEVGQPCHASYKDKEVTQGTYDTVNNELACHDTREWILCHKDDTSDDAPLCVDGNKD